MFSVFPNQISEEFYLKISGGRWPKDLKNEVEPYNWRN